MILKQTRQIVLNSVLLLMLILTLVVVENGESKDPKSSLDADRRAFAEILQRITSTEREVNYVGTRLSISWTPTGCFAQEELVIHQPPSTHVVKVLAPRAGPRTHSRLEGTRKRREELQRKERRGKLTPREALMRRRLERGAILEQRPQSIESMSEADIDLLSQNYTLQHTASEKIAGYETDLLTISPRFEGRPTKRIWLAKGKGLILRHEELNAHGSLGFLSVYTQISFQPQHVQQKLAAFVKDEKTQPQQPNPIEVISLSAAQEAFKGQLIVPDSLPQGFQLQRIGLMKFGQQPAVHLRYTDGLVVFSLFQESAKKRPRDRRRDSSTRRGEQIQRIHDTPVQIIDRRQIQILRWSQGKISLTLIGKLNRAEMIRIAESLIAGSAQQ